MLYNIGFLIFSLFYLPALAFKGKMHGDFNERFADYGAETLAKLTACGGAIWIQAVSVGEVGLCRGLIPLLKEKFPGRPVVLSTITRTGNELAKKLFGASATVIYFPLDLSWIVRKAVSAIRPGIYIMVETEIWPNVITELNRRGIPSVLINGRISDKSFGKYILARPFLSGVLRKISGFAMQSRLDAQRIIRMGAPEDKVAVTGTMKFDIEAKADAASVNDIALKLGLGPSGRLFVAGSTHPGEEEPVLTTYKELVGEYPELKLLIAPRHVERAPEIEKLIVNYGFSPVRLSAPPIPDTRYPKPRVFILDTIGHLTTAYALASVVFIGGSFIMHGGQNPIEPAMMGKAVVFGPYMFNFKEPVRLLLEGKGAAQALYPLYLTGEVRRLLKNPAAALALGDNARRIVAANRGATARNLDIIGGILGRPVKG